MKRKTTNTSDTGIVNFRSQPDTSFERVKSCFRSLTEKAVRNATNLLQEYEKCPEKHPMYPSEWKRYWNRRSKELEAGE